MCHFLLGCAYTICFYGQISISWTFPSGLLCQPSCVSPYIHSVQICCIHLLGDWLFHLCHRIANIYCFVVSYLFLLWWLVLMALSCVAIRRDSVSLFSFPFLSKVQKKKKTKQKTNMFIFMNLLFGWVALWRPPFPPSRVLSDTSFVIVCAFIYYKINCFIFVKS